MVRDIDFTTLTYRQLAAALGISLMAARTRVRRAAASGRWRIVPANRPGAPAYVQIPTSELAEGRRSADTVEKVSRLPQAEPARKQGQELDGAIIDTLRSAYRHIERLHRTALVEKDERRAAELRCFAAERLNDHLRSEIARLEAWAGDLDGRLSGELAEKSQVAAVIARLELKERQYAHRVIELQSRIEDLRRRLRRARTPWWKRPFLKREG